MNKEPYQQSQIIKDQMTDFINKGIDMVLFEINSLDLAKGKEYAKKLLMDIREGNNKNLESKFWEKVRELDIELEDDREQER